MSETSCTWLSSTRGAVESMITEVAAANTFCCRRVWSATAEKSMAAVPSDQPAAPRERAAAARGGRTHSAKPVPIESPPGLASRVESEPAPAGLTGQFAPTGRGMDADAGAVLQGPARDSPGVGSHLIRFFARCGRLRVRAGAGAGGGPGRRLRRRRRATRRPGSRWSRGPSARASNASGESAPWSWTRARVSRRPSSMPCARPSGPTRPTWSFLGHDAAPGGTGAERAGPERGRRRGTEPPRADPGGANGGHPVPPALCRAGSGRRAGDQARSAGLPLRRGLSASCRTRRGRAADWLALGRTLLRYALFHNDTDNTHEGYNTLIQMDQAPRYNAWLGRKLRPHLGQRVLEIGAGIGTITREIAPGRERVIALEADAFYVQRLRNLFRGSERRPAGPRAGRADRLGRALSGAAGHGDAEQRPRAHRGRCGGRPPLPERPSRKAARLVILVPALMALYGSIDEAIGHFRRYTPESLRAVIEANGFRLESLEWLNLLGIPGWFLNSRVLRRRSVPGLQVRLYDRLAPLLARLESTLKLPVGMSLLAVARATPESGVER